MFDVCRQPLNDDYCGLVSEHQFAIKGIDENGLKSYRFSNGNTIASCIFEYISN